MEASAGSADDPPTTHHGFLTKRAMKSKRTWRRRYFVLDSESGSLSYYSSKPEGSSAALGTSTRPRGTLQLVPRSRCRPATLREAAAALMVDDRARCFVVEWPAQGGGAACGAAAAAAAGSGGLFGAALGGLGGMTEAAHRLNPGGWWGGGEY